MTDDVNAVPRRPVSDKRAESEGSRLVARFLAWVRSWRERFPNAYQFVMFNLLANIATISNFLVLFLSTEVLFVRWSGADYVWGPFDYSVANGGLAGFLSFLLAYAVAQTVNFIVQRKLVFQSNSRLAPAIALYLVAVVVVYFICLYVPTLVIPVLTPRIGGWAPYAANVFNIMIQVVILFPTMKFFVMRSTPGEPARSGD